MLAVTPKAQIAPPRKPPKVLHLVGMLALVVIADMAVSTALFWLVAPIVANLAHWIGLPVACAALAAWWQRDRTRLLRASARRGVRDSLEQAGL